MALLALPGLVLLAIFFIAVRVESRRFGLGLLLSLALLELGGVALGTALPVLAATTSGEVGTWALLGVFFLLVAGIAVLGAFLIVNAFTMLRKEGFGLSTLLSAGLGVAVLAYLAGAVLVLMSDRTDWFVWLAGLGLPAAYVAFLFVSYLLYSQLYQWGTRRFGGPVDAVVVLGSGLGGGERVTPLLAGRIERGRAVFEKSVEAGRSPILIVSGGQGRDEKLSEAEAMRRYLLERDFPADSLVREDRSTDTEENLANSAQLMKRWQAEGEVAVATSNYHAFRSAVIMRKAGIPGYTVGCRTARYYWPSATIREFGAILLEHSRINLAIILLLCLPAVLLTFNWLTTA